MPNETSKTPEPVKRSFTSAVDAKAASSTSGGTVSRGANTLLTAMRAAAANFDGLTVTAAARLIGADNTTRKGGKATRQALRDAQSSGRKAGDLVCTVPIGGRRFMYYVVPASMANTLDTADVEGLYTRADSFAFGAHPVKGRFEE